MEYVLSLEGQKLWSFRADPEVEGAPKRFSLRRTAIRPDLFQPEFTAYLSDPNYRPYERASQFYYHVDWTGPLFSEIRFLIRVMCLDLHPELKAAWKALIDHEFPPDAVRLFEDVSVLSYERVLEEYAPIVGSGNPEDEVVLARELGEVFRQQYAEVVRLARASDS